MSLIQTITFKVISTGFFSKLVYLFKRVFIRIGNKFLLYFFIALILAVLITFFYYKYISRLLKIEERKILNLLKRFFRPLFRKKKYIAATEHELFTKRQLRKRMKRKKMLDMFSSTELKKKSYLGGVEKREKKKNIGEVDEDGYVMWPPKPKEEMEEVFDKLSKVK